MIKYEILLIAHIYTRIIKESSYPYFMAKIANIQLIHLFKAMSFYADIIYSLVEKTSHEVESLWMKN